MKNLHSKIDFSKHDLTNEKGRGLAIRLIDDTANVSFQLDCGISEQSLVEVFDWNIFIRIKDPSKPDGANFFAADVELTATTQLTRESPIKRVQTEVGISAGGNGGFNPVKRPQFVEKFRNIAALLNNWDKTLVVFNYYTSEHRRLRELIEQQNNLK